jgi:molybdopterin-guanine dinucleotide biosynthesis protein A
MAGGKSSRMGTDKLTLPLNNSTLPEAAIARFRREFSDVRVSVREDGVYPHISAPKIADVKSGLGPIGGLYAALTALKRDVFIVAADMPYSDPLAAKKIIELGSGFDAAALLGADSRLEPLFAFYSYSALTAAEAAIEAGIYKMNYLLKQLHTRAIAPAELGELYSDKLLLNINYPEDYKLLLNCY